MSNQTFKPSRYDLYIVILWMYPGWKVLSDVIQGRELADRTADLERVKHKDYEQDVCVVALSTVLYEGRATAKQQPMRIGAVQPCANPLCPHKNKIQRQLWEVPGGGALPFCADSNMGGESSCYDTWKAMLL